MYIASTSDNFVPCSHAEELYKLTASPKKVLEYIEKEHNSPRDHQIFAMGVQFMKKCLEESTKKTRRGKVLNGNNMAELITKPSSIAERNKKVKKRESGPAQYQEEEFIFRKK